MADMRAHRISIRIILIGLFLLGIVYQIKIRHLLLTPGIMLACIDAILFSAVLWITIRLDLAKVTIGFLALPYLFFIPGWLNTVSVIIILPVFTYCLYQAIATTHVRSKPFITIDDLAAFVLILVWVNLSGAGGYGAQTQDYRMHNARLNDLIHYSWPVHYGENKNLVYYIGYFLPAAALGKLTSFNIAEKMLYLWTLLGATLSIQWLQHLSKWKYTLPLVLVFIFFGPIDLLNIVYNSLQAGISLLAGYSTLIPTMDHLDFSTSLHLKFFIGNFLPNTFQLYWSPQQVIAGWLCAGLAMELFLKNNSHKIIFIYSLLCLWAPLVMLALSPFILLTVIVCLVEKRWRELLTFENTAGSLVLLLPFVIFYLSGSTSNNLSVWITNAFAWREYWDNYIIFNMAGWLIFTALVFYQTSKESLKYRLWFYCLILAFIVIQIRTFGEYSDLLCRGSAPLMFILLVYCLRAIDHHWLDGRRVAAIGLICVIAAGASSAIVQNMVAIRFYGARQAVGTVPEFANAYPNFGPDNSLFEQWLRRPLPESVQTK